MLSFYCCYGYDSPAISFAFQVCLLIFYFSWVSFRSDHLFPYLLNSILRVSIHLSVEAKGFYCFDLMPSLFHSVYLSPSLYSWWLPRLFYQLKLLHFPMNFSWAYSQTKYTLFAGSQTVVLFLVYRWLFLPVGCFSTGQALSWENQILFLHFCCGWVLSIHYLNFC